MTDDFEKLIREYPWPNEVTVHSTQIDPSADGATLDATIVLALPGGLWNVQCTARVDPTEDAFLKMCHRHAQIL